MDSPRTRSFVDSHAKWSTALARVLRRDGRTPPLTERDGIAKVDAVVLGPNSEVTVFFRFRDYCGPFMNHCHNLEHEDHAMMFRFDVVGDEQHDCGRRTDSPPPGLRRRGSRDRRRQIATRAAGRMRGVRGGSLERTRPAGNQGCGVESVATGRFMSIWICSIVSTRL